MLSTLRFGTQAATHFSQFSLIFGIKTNNTKCVSSDKMLINNNLDVHSICIKENVEVEVNSDAEETIFRYNFINTIA